MDHALDTMATGLQASQVMMDTIADNLSNVNTTGFKAEAAQFQTLLYRTAFSPGRNPPEPRSIRPASNSAPVSRQPQSRQF